MRLMPFLLLVSLIAGCASSRLPPLPLADNVDLPRFMGAWFVIGFIPLYPERQAHNGIERYQLDDKGHIQVAYRFRQGSFDGELKSYFPSAEVVPDSGAAVWKMQFLWPFKADFRISHLSDDQQEVVIARQARDYVWLMSRSPQMSEERFAYWRQRIADMGYDVSDFVRQPQRWPEASPRTALPAPFDH